MKYPIFMFLLSLIAANPALPGPIWYELTDAEKSLIERGISQKLLDPESARISDLMASKDPTGMTIVCGKVSGKNSFGGYAQPTPFIGSLAQNTSGETLFIVINIAGPKANEQIGVLKTCLSYMPPSTSG